MTNLVLGLAVTCAAVSVCLADNAGPRLRPVPFTQVHVEDAFWGPRIETNRTSTLEACLKQCEDTGRISNFSKAAGKLQGEYEGRFYNDSDVYKVLEGAAYCLAQHRDPKLEARIDAIIAEIAAAQEPDGYLNAFYTVMKPDKKWTNLAVMHELYCAGHMFEAAVAYAQATGKTQFLDVARRKADHIDNIFGPGKRIGWPGHQEIELALVKLYHHTGEERYAKLAQFFIDVRGTFHLENFENPSYMQAHQPIREQTDVVGHAVRALYMYAGVADVAALTGDPTLFATMDTIWHNIADKKMYITGGVGSRHHGEAFGDPYELPNDTAYCETCAAIGLVLWNHRLNLLHGDGKYVDVVERAIYNGVLSGVSLEGDKFFYVNPLSSNGTTHRQAWFGTACCPTNIVRIIPSIPGYVYATDGTDVWANLYVASTARATLQSGEVKLVQKTDYPWSGQIALTVEPARAAEFSIHLRIPQWWCREPAVKVAGQPWPAAQIDKGYLRIRREWKPGDTIELSLPMPVERMVSHPLVAANVGRVALQRGPVVYCLEGVDHGGRVADLSLPQHVELVARKEPGLLGGVVTIKAQALRADPPNWDGKLYQPLPAARPAPLTAVPYCVWDHREAGQMIVWIPETTGLAAEQPAPLDAPRK